MIDISRRLFLAGAAASGARFLGAAPCGEANLRLGVLSDIHIFDEKQVPVFERALEFFRDRKADGVIIAGDMADRGLVDQLELVANAWFKVFPANRRPDGQPVEKLFVYGNHDVLGHGYGDTPKTLAEKYPDEKEQAAHRIATDRKAVWERLFKEPWAGVYAKQVKGYTFIGSHWGYEKKLAAFMKDNATRLGLKGPKPFFYAQHPHPKDTIYGPWAWGHDNGASTRAFSKTPNAIVFTGHSHYPLTDESGIWQDTFTSIGTASLRYIGHRYNRENSGYGGGPVEQMPRMKDGHSKHGLLVSVFDDHIDVARRDFQNDESLGADWVLPLPLCKEKPYAIPPRAVKARENLPAFAADAGSLIKAEDVDGKDRRGTPTPQTVVTFPTALAGGRAFDYEVQAELNYYDVTRVFCTKRVFAPEYFRTESKLAKEGQIVFARVAEVPEHVDVRFVVTPLDCYGNRGKSIYSKKFKLGEAKK